MKCYDCGGEYIEKCGSLQLNDETIGDYTVTNVKYQKCNQCGEFLFPEDTLEAIEAKEVEAFNQLIKNRPIEEFITATEAAQILGISRQAIHKHRRISRGFIHSTIFEGRRVYLKESVELYKKTGDGRFPLAKQPESVQVKYVLLSIPARREELYVTHNQESASRRSHGWASIDSPKPTGPRYAHR